MDSLPTIAAPAAARYAATARTPGAEERARELAEERSAAPAPQATTVTLSRRAQELVAQERAQAAKDDAQANARQAAADTSEAAQATQQGRTAAVAERAATEGADAQARQQTAQQQASDR